MIGVASLRKQEREELLLNTAEKMEMHPAIIEKDFWVCYMLDYLFDRNVWKDRMVFKGGTSLSKAYHLIERFSEDIDLILDWKLLGYELNEPWEERTNTQQNKFSIEAEGRTEMFLKREFIPILRKDISTEVHEPIDIFLDITTEPTVNFVYPQNFNDSSILQVIRLELGILSTWSPSKKVTITPFAAEKYPQIFTKRSTSIKTVIPERTFWEKVTILHREAHRINGISPPRYSRHYYDLYCMINSPVKDNAYTNIELLKEVITFKTKFYYSSWANYEKALPGTMKLVPNEQCLESLEQDYFKMSKMIYGRAPDFMEIISSIQKLQDEINELYIER